MADFNEDGKINFDDFVLLSNNFKFECEHPDWCDGADANFDGFANFDDFVVLSNNLG